MHNNQWKFEASNLRTLLIIKVFQKHVLEKKEPAQGRLLVNTNQKIHEYR